MTKLYISYYGDSITIVEGSCKKNKFKINDVTFMTSDEIEPDYSDKYKLLKEALKNNISKSKKVVLCLNTVDVIVKSTKIPKVNAKDLDNLMSVEIDELISLDREQYTMSYEVMRELEEQGDELLDLVLAGIETNEVKTLVDIFEEFNLKLDYIDILPTAYARVLKEVEYEDMMVINTGEYSTSIDIYKEDSLFIHDNVPVKLTKDAQVYEYIRLVDEANGLMNYYSSRNFGKTIETILLIGTHVNNKELIDSFKKVFTSEFIIGIDNLYDIYNDIHGDLSEENLNRSVEIIGCMLRDIKKSPYLRMNILPEYIKTKNLQNKKIKKYLKIAPIVVLVSSIPMITLDIMSDFKEQELQQIKIQVDEIKKEYKKIEEIEADIAKKQQEIEIYDMLIKKVPMWGEILSAIDKNIPYKVQLDKLDVKYIDFNSEDNKDGNNENQDTENQTDKEEEPIYNKVPNFITITGNAKTPSLAGQFLYNLKKLPYFEDIKLSGVTEKTSGNEKNKKTSYSFSITAKIKDGVMRNE